MKGTMLLRIERRRHAVRLEGAIFTGLRTTRERPASPLHHDVTRNSTVDSRDVAESVPWRLRKELNRGRFFPGRRRLQGVWHGSCGNPDQLVNLNQT